MEERHCNVRYMWIRVLNTGLSDRRQIFGRLKLYKYDKCDYEWQKAELKNHSSILLRSPSLLYTSF